MEKRKAYIIASLIILSLITVLALWYLYTAKQELNIGQVTGLDLYGVVGGGDMYSSNNNQSSTQVSNITSTQSNSGVSSDINATTSATTNEIQKTETWQLSQIYTDPVVGVNTTNGVVRFVDQKTGNILVTTNGDTLEKLSEDVLQDVNSAYFTSTNSALILHNHTSMYPTSIYFANGTSTTTSMGPHDEIIESTQSTVGGDIYYTTIDIARRKTLLKSMDDPTNELWDSILSGWLLQALDEYIVITQKASGGIPGYAYMIPKSGVNDNAELLLLVRDLPGLITNVSPNAKQLLYSTTDHAGTRLYLKSTENVDVIRLSIETLANKCAWGIDNETLYCAVPNKMDGTLPDDWYKGLIHFSDSLWRINSKTGDAIELAHNTGLDIIEIKEGAVNGIIVFKNKTDQSLWSVIQD